MEGHPCWGPCSISWSGPCYSPVGKRILGFRSICHMQRQPENAMQTSLCSGSLSARTERLWKDYFADPSHWWDNRKSKTNPKAPDFKHKVSKESLWIDGRYNPSCVKDMLEKMEEESSSARLSKSTVVLREDNINGNAGGWETVSLEDAVASLEEGMLPQPSIENLVYIVSKCTKERKLAYALRLHAYIHKNGLEDHSLLGNCLVSMLVEVGSMHDAQKVFDRLVSRSESSWNSLINGYIKCGESSRGLTLYHKMQEDSVHPSGHTFVALLKACAKLKNVERGRQIHAEIARKGLLKTNLFVGNTLVDMYAKCGSLAKAQEVFDKLPIRDVVSWNALIAGYAQHERGYEALKCFKQMQLEGVSPNAITFACSLKACGSIGAIDKGREIHAEIERKGLLERHLVLGSTLVDMYAKCGLLGKAQQVFDRLPVLDVVTWTALIAGYVQHEHGEEALNCLEQMQLEGVPPNAITFACGLKACGSVGAIGKGREIHAEIERKGLLKRDLVLGTALVDMYAKCGLLAKAQDVFDKLPVRDVAAWNSLITGYAQQGEIENVLWTFDRMRGEGNKPNRVTFVSILNACSHTGLLDKGQTYFEAMSEDYGITPTLDHHTCMVDLLGRAGQLEWAVAMMKKTPFHPNFVLWHTVLGACRKWGNVELGRKAFEQVVRFDEKDAAAYICMYNIYADADMLEDAMKVKAMSEKTGVID